jgi:formylglycine-generating enzyme required for sulfatase activity
MGSDSQSGGSYDAKPEHRVTVPSFFMGKYPITQIQWKALRESHSSRFKGAKRPVENVFWREAGEFCHDLSRMTGRYYRVPSEAEWEYACRAGTTTPFYFGETITTDLANYSPGNETTDVGSFPPNAFGLYDMHGNVWEWCADPYHENYEGAPTDGSAWILGGSHLDKVIVRGACGSRMEQCSSTYRSSQLINHSQRHNVSAGFRVVFSCPSVPGS